MSYYRLNVYAPNVIFVCVDDYGDCQIKGRCYHKAGTEPVIFRGVAPMIMDLDEIFDLLGNPQASTRTRKFGKQSKGVLRKKEVPPLNLESGVNQKGEKATFIVQVRYRQNATWQGNVVWAERNEKKSFRSALELIKLMDSALEESDVPTEEEHQE